MKDNEIRIRDIINLFEERWKNELEYKVGYEDFQNILKTKASKVDFGVIQKILLYILIQNLLLITRVI